jgi:hypothetical protein
MQKVLDQQKKRALTVDAFCFNCSVCRTLAYAEIAAGRLHSVKLGRKRLIPDESAEEWFANLDPNHASIDTSIKEAVRAA